VTGPAGCGKSTIAKYLADIHQFPYIEGDDVRFYSDWPMLRPPAQYLTFAQQFHPPANVEKMSADVPLTDADRWDWLIQLREVAVDALDTGVSGVVLTCSALKRKYRDVIRVARLDDHDVLVHFLYLRASEELLMQRVKARQGHYMKPSMIKSQLQSLEEPKEKERDVLSIDVSGSKADVQKMALDAVRGVMAQDLVGSRKS
jgi:gluconokinase